MPRPTKSRSDRALDVARAAADLPRLVNAAMDAEKLNGPNDAATLRAWENVENAGATVHRQARLLAGKARGG
jgi:hypothetical protein